MVDKNLSLTSISQNERKLLTSLRLKKYRDIEGLFIAEGEKVISQLLQKFQIELLLVSEEVYPSGSSLQKKVEPKRVRTASSKLMRSLSGLESRHEYIAIFRKRKTPTLPKKMLTLSIGLEAIQNPGNMGTLIRLCDWLGITSVFCSKGCVDVYSPKVVQATAGALGNVDIYNDIELSEELPNLFEEVVGTTLSGISHTEYTPSSSSTIILFGNEGNGLTDKTLNICDHSISITPEESTVSDSLNVSISAAILLSYYKNK